MPVAPLGIGVSLSLRGSVGLFLQTPRISYWQQHCWGYAELAHFPGCPSHVLALLFFPHLPSSDTILATLNPCIWWRKLQVVTVPLRHPHPTVLLLSCLSLSGNSSGSILAPTTVQRNITWSDPHLLLRTDCAVCIMFLTKSLLFKQRNYLLWRCFRVYSWHFTFKYKHKYFPKGADLELILRVQSGQVKNFQLFKLKYYCGKFTPCEIEKERLQHTFMIAFRKMSVSFIAFSSTTASKEEIIIKKPTQNLKVSFSKYSYKWKNCRKTSSSQSQILQWLLLPSQYLFFLSWWKLSFYFLWMGRVISLLLAWSCLLKDCK